MTDKKTWKSWAQANTARLIGISNTRLSQILELRNSVLWRKLKEECKGLDEVLEMLGKEDWKPL